MCNALQLLVLNSWSSFSLFAGRIEQAVERFSIIFLLLMYLYGPFDVVTNESVLTHFSKRSPQCIEVTDVLVPQSTTQSAMQHSSFLSLHTVTNVPRILVSKAPATVSGDGFSVQVLHQNVFAAFLLARMET